jgi:hypothetical protein
MVRVLHLRNYGVYVADERGERHHSPHAHVKERGRRIASVHLVTLETLIEIDTVPNDLMDLIRDNQELLLAEWEALNP